MSSIKGHHTRAITVKTTFSRETSISIPIQSSASVVWKILTEAVNYPKWNSAIISIDGEIGLNKKIVLKSTLDPKRVFKLRIKEFEPERRLVWGDGQGNRIYSIEDNGDGSLTFSMSEKIGGLMFPIYASMIPSFDSSFESFAGDLKKEAERLYNL